MATGGLRNKVELRISTSWALDNRARVFIESPSAVITASFFVFTIYKHKYVVLLGSNLREKRMRDVFTYGFIIQY